MKSPFSNASKSVRVNSEGVQQELTRVIGHLEATTRRVGDARFRKIAMKSTEVLKGLRTLFERIGSEGDTVKPPGHSNSDVHDAKTSGRPSETAGKKSAKSDTKSGRSTKQNGGIVSSPVKGPLTVSEPKGTKAATRTRKIATTIPASEPSELGASVPVVAIPKPEDPDEIAAKARRQQQEARAPKRPGGRAAPRPLPPQSGKPIWSKPHSS